MDYQKVYEVFETLSADSKRLCSLLDKKPSESEVVILRALNTSNVMYQKELIAMVRQSFPDTSFEVRRWSEENRKSWLLLLNKYSPLWDGQEENLISIFCGMDVVGELYQYRDLIVPILKNRQMIHYAATCSKESIVSALHSLINFFVPLAEHEWFSDEVELAKHRLL